jgi:acetylxylan esterase
MSFHLDYFDKWGTETADWVVSKAREAAGINQGGDATSGASDMLKKGISHPISNVILLLIAIFGL